MLLKTVRAKRVYLMYTKMPKKSMALTVKKLVTCSKCSAAPVAGKRRPRLVLFATLRSVRQSVLILLNVPFALVGGILALWASGSYLSVPASVGFIALLGIAVLNGLVLVSHFNQLIDAGRPLAEAVFEGAVRRLRPVLMTATIAACGLVPLLFASGPGSEIQKPLAIVVIGGLITSTALTLVLLPILFRRFGVARTTTATTMERPAWISPFAS